ncbi:MAG: GNAT family N-acetyltransferase [Saprospiraceae bacterium]
MLPLIYETQHLILRPYRRQDQVRFVEMFLDPSLAKYMDDHLKTEGEALDFFEKIFELYAAKMDSWFWVWGIYEKDKLCGHLEVKETEHTNATQLEIVYIIHFAERRKGLMTEVLAFLKKQSKIWKKQIIATVDPENTNSIALLQKWGITQQATLHDSATGAPYLKLSLAE